MTQIRKGFIAANAIDGTKLKLLNNDSIRAANADGTESELMKLDSSNVLQFLKLPQVSSDPSQDNDVARKSYVDAQVSAASSSAADGLASEQSAREAADSGLQSAIDTEKGRIDAILTAATADADSFAEIVNLINSVDTENDSAFAAYALSNDAALAQEVSDRQSAVSSEASARESADTTLQSNIDAEASARASAVSGEASARQSADALLQAAMDAMTTESLTDVATDSKADGDLFQWDATEGKWKNVAPLSQASSATTSTPGVGTTVYSVNEIVDANGLPHDVGGKMAFRLDLSGPSSISNIAVKMYSVSGTVTVPVNVRLYANSGSNLPGSYIATSTQQVTNLSAWPGTSSASAASPLNIPFDNVSVDSVVWVSFEYDTMPTSGGLFVLATAQNSSGQVGFTYGLSNNYETADFGNYNSSSLKLAAVVTSAGEEQTGTEAAVGVIKTNSSGLLDDSFVSSAIARVSDMDAADSAEQAAREAADSALQSNLDSESSARQDADSAEQSAREAADSDLQSQIDALDSGSNAALAQEISDRQAADSAEQSAREAADSAEQSARESADATLQSNIDSESSARQAADTTLQSNIDTEKARIDAILTAATADADSFAEIVNLINSVDTENDSAFASYVLSNDAALAAEVFDRQAAVSAEQADREAADSTLQGNIDAEAVARQDADTSLQNEVDAVESALAQEVSDRTDAVSAEQSAREAADSAEVTAREAADSALQAVIDDLASSNATALAQEVSDREAADSAEIAAREAADFALQTAIDLEVSDRTMALSAEQADREAADSAEQAAREAADSTLQGNIDSEESAREAADSALDTRVTALEAVSHYKAKFVLSATDISNGYVDLAMECTPDSEMVFVGALYLHSGDHYTVSTVGSATRLTWANDVMVGGASELVEGDVVYVRYKK